MNREKLARHPPTPHVISTSRVMLKPTTAHPPSHCHSLHLAGKMVSPASCLPGLGFYICWCMATNLVSPGPV